MLEGIIEGILGFVIGFLFFYTIAVQSKKFLLHLITVNTSGIKSDIKGSLTYTRKNRANIKEIKEYVKNIEE